MNSKIIKGCEMQFYKVLVLVLIGTLVGCGGGKNVKPASGLDIGYNYNHLIKGERYFARLKKDDGRWLLSELSGSPLDRNNINEEILVVSSDLRRIQPAFKRLHVSRSGRTFVCNAPLRELDKGLMSGHHKKKKYNGCNSHLMEAANGTIPSPWGTHYVVQVDVLKVDKIVTEVNLISAMRMKKEKLSSDSLFYLEQTKRKKIMAREKEQKEAARIAMEKEKERKFQAKMIIEGGIGNRICKTEARINYFGYVEKIVGSKSQVRVSDARIKRGATLRPRGFRPGIIWDEPGNWYLCDFR